MAVFFSAYLAREQLPRGHQAAANSSVYGFKRVWIQIIFSLMMHRHQKAKNRQYSFPATHLT